MAELTYPHYRLNANGPSETGFSITLQIQEGAGGPLAGHTTESVLTALRDLLKGGNVDVSTELTKFEITSTYT